MYVLFYGEYFREILEAEMYYTAVYTQWTDSSLPPSKDIHVLAFWIMNENSIPAQDAASGGRSSSKKQSNCVWALSLSLLEHYPSPHSFEYCPFFEPKL